MTGLAQMAQFGTKNICSSRCFFAYVKKTAVNRIVWLFCIFEKLVNFEIGQTRKLCQGYKFIPQTSSQLWA